MSVKVDYSRNGSPRLVVIGIDGTDRATLERHLLAGWLPEIQKLASRARSIAFENQGDLFITSPWASLASGVAVENHGIHAFRPIRSGTMEIVNSEERIVPTPFWETAVQAGLKAFVLDSPICAPPAADAQLPGLEFVEWGPHPPNRPVGSYPPSLIQPMIREYGYHPCTADDLSLTTADALISVRDRICEGVRVRERILTDRIRRGAVDLLVATFPEAHVAGHQFLNLEAPDHPHHNAAVAQVMGETPLKSVFQAIDTAIGKIVACLTQETNVLIVCHGGVRVTYGGSLLLNDLLIRIGLSVTAPVKTSLFNRCWKQVPEPIRRFVARRLPKLARRRSDAKFLTAFQWDKTRAFCLPWSFDGYLRINQRGREPQGIVEPGPERAELLELVESHLRELCIAGTDRPAVRQIVRPQEEYFGRASNELPDLLVMWNNDQPLEAVESPRVGRIENRERGKRSCHTPYGAIYAWGPSVASGAPLSGAHVIDVAPTALQILGISPPPSLDGQSIPHLLNAANFPVHRKENHEDRAA